MTSPTGLYAALDSGAPEGSSDYTTVVLVHGYGWHSDIFAPLLPHAAAQNARVIAVNRRDYPGATPYTPDERAPLLAVTSAAATTTTTSTSSTSPTAVPPVSTTDVAVDLVSLAGFMRARGHELRAFLAELVHERALPATVPGANAGGLVVAGWSLGIVWMNALLAGLVDAPPLEAAGVDLSKYLRRVILYDGPSFQFGFPRPADDYDPFVHPEQYAADPAGAADWVSGYFTHGASGSVHALERRTPARDRPPTLRTLAPDAAARLVHGPPGAPGGSDYVLVGEGHRVGLFGVLWNAAVALPLRDEEDPEVDESEGEGKGEGEEKGVKGWKRWTGVEVRVVWGDRSTWEIAHAALWVRAQVAEARAMGRGMRDVRTLRLRGANHFAHWDFPAKTLSAFLMDVVDGEPELRVAEDAGVGIAATAEGPL